jgi:hypothetical protein
MFKIINKFKSINLAQAVNLTLLFVLMITVISVFVPFSPTMPTSGLDSSWMFGMNQATAQGLSFGKELIFTFGPYASIYTKMYHPSLDFLMLGGSLYLALSYWLCFVVLIKGVRWSWVLAYCAVLAGLMYSRDSLLFSLPLLIGLLTYKILFWEEGRLAKNKLTPFCIALLFMSFGLLPLTKGSLIILCGATTVLCSALFVIKKHNFLAAICLLSPIVSMPLFWIASGQSVSTCQVILLIWYPWSPATQKLWPRMDQFMK